MLHNNTMTIKHSHHILPINQLFQIITKNDFPLHSVKHSNNQKVLSKSKTIFPFQTHSNMGYKKTKPKIQNLRTRLHNINNSKLILKNLLKRSIKVILPLCSFFECKKPLIVMADFRQKC